MTYKEFARIMRCSENTSKKMLHNFVIKKLDILNGVTYYLSGIRHVCDFTEVEEIRIVNDYSLMNVLSSWKKLISYHIYSIQVETTVDFLKLQDSQRSIFKDNIQTSLQQGSVYNDRVLKVVNDIDFGRLQPDSAVDHRGSLFAFRTSKHYKQLSMKNYVEHH